ncbi:MAG: aldo/keto reductase, partial [Nitrososphaera sp.]
GKAEELLGHMLPKSDSGIVIATKVGLLPSLVPGTSRLARDFSTSHIRASLEASLSRLRRECIDLYQLHNPDVETLRSDETWTTVEKLKEAGKIKYFGVSLSTSRFEPACFGDLIKNPLVSSIQIQYSLMHIDLATSIDNWETDDCGIIARSPFEHGFLTGKYGASEQFPADDHRSRKFDIDTTKRVQEFLHHISAMFPDRSSAEVALLYVVSSPKITLTLFGATSAHQVRQNSKLLEKPNFTEEERMAIRQVAEKCFH